VTDRIAREADPTRSLPAAGRPNDRAHRPGAVDARAAARSSIGGRRWASAEYRSRIARTLHITGPGDQRITGPSATPDGFAWIRLASLRHDDLEPEAVFQIGDHSFPPGNYLFELVL